MAKNNNIRKNNRKYVEQRLLDERKKKYDAARKRLRIFPLISLALVILLLVFMLVDWAAIYNTDIAGNEVKISGFNCVSAGLSGDYSSADASYGNMAVPFNYYASDYVHRLAPLTVVVLFVLIAHILIEVFAVITNKQGAFNVLTILCAAAEFALFIACYAIALSMNDSQILPKYCNSNPACSIRSEAILPALFALISLASPILGMIYSKKARRILAE